METLAHRYGWLAQLIGIAACAFLLAHAAARALDDGDRARAWPTARRILHAPPRAETITRNIFCSACRAGADASPPAWRRSERRLQLVATVLAPPVLSDRTVALVRDLDEQRLRAVGVGASLGGATVESILPGRVYLRAGDMVEVLDLGGPPAGPTLGPATPGAMPAIRTIGPDRYEISRAALDELLGNTNELARGVRLVPESREGRPAGFRLRAVDRDGALGRIGLESGDLVSAVNGLPLLSAESALQAYVKLRSASHLSLELERNGRRMSKEVLVR